MCASSLLSFFPQMVKYFKSGVLPLNDGTTLRSLLSTQLHCVPMRITKKFSRDSSIGKVRDSLQWWCLVCCIRACVFVCFSCPVLRRCPVLS